MAQIERLMFREYDIRGRENDEELNIEQHEHHNEPILVNPPIDNAESGKYIFNTRVTVHDPSGDTTQYGNSQQFIVTIK